MAELKSKEFYYNNFIKWEEEKKGVISSEGKPSFQVTTPPEFHGHPGIWNPEELFLAAVNSCIMTTFLYFAEKRKLEFASYQSKAEGILKSVENKLMFSEVTIKPFISIKNESDIETAKKLIELAENNCLISNSIKSKVKIIPEISVS